MNMQTTAPIRLDSEIDLLAICRILFQKKIIVLLVTLLFLGFGYSKIYFTTPVYETDVVLEIPSMSKIESLNFGRFSFAGGFLHQYEGKDLYALFVSNLYSESTKKDFFNKILWPSLSKKSHDSMDKNALYQEFSKSLIFDAPKGVFEQQLRELDLLQSIVKFRSSNSEQSSAILKQYLEFAQGKTMQEIRDYRKAEIQSIARQMHHQIEIAKDRLDPRLDRLQSQYVLLKTIHQIEEKPLSIYSSTAEIEYSTFLVPVRKNFILGMYLILGLFFGSMLALCVYNWPSK